MLDWQMYPHIFETIMRLLPPESLLALRTCSHDARILADRRLFRHLEADFSNGTTTPKHLVVKPFGSTLSLPLLVYPHYYRFHAKSVRESAFWDRKELQCFVQTLVYSSIIIDPPSDKHRTCVESDLIDTLFYVSRQTTFRRYESPQYRS